MKKRKCPIWRKCAYGGAASLLLINTLSTSALAADWGSINLSASGGDNPNEALAKPLGLVVTGIQLIGFIILVYGFYDVVSSFISNNGEVKMKAIATAVIGVILMSMKSVLQQCGIIE